MPPVTAAEIIAALQLQPLPNEGGFYRRTYTSATTLPGGRAVGTAIYFLITPDGFSALHRLQTEEVWHFYAGDPVEHVMLDPASRQGLKTILGTDLMGGQRPQLGVPAGRWQGARLVPGGAWALLGCTMSPGWDEREFQLGDAFDLVGHIPGFLSEIAALTR